MNEYYTDGRGRVHCYNSYRLRELGLPADMRPATDQEIEMFQMVEKIQSLEKLVKELADHVGFEWRK